MMFVTNESYNYLKIDRKTKEVSWTPSKNQATRFASKNQIRSLKLPEGSYTIREQLYFKQALRLARKVIRKQGKALLNKNTKVGLVSIFNTSSMGFIYFSVSAFHLVDKSLNVIFEVSFDKDKTFIVGIYEEIEQCQKPF